MTHDAMLLVIALLIVVYLVKTQQPIREHGPISGAILNYNQQDLSQYSQNLMNRYATNWSL